jgi:uncharacterized Tic20 family protein
MNTSTTSEDRIWAVISHLSSLAFGMGILLPIVGWSDRRRKSNYASFQSLQALGYQSVGFTVWFLSYLVLVIVGVIVLIIMSFQAESAGQSFDPRFGPGTMLFFIMIVGFFAIYFLLPIIAAVACAFGKDFRYPILGNRLARYLDYEPTQITEAAHWLNEDREFRWVAGMGHFSILIMLWGMLAPLTSWILYGKRSQFLRFQSIQTVIYQAGTTILYFAGGFIYLFGFFLFFVVMGVSGNPNLNSPEGMFGILVFGVTLLISFLFLLVVPLLHILGQWAGYRVLKGDNYRYPLIGNMVEKWLRSRSDPEHLSRTEESLT